MKTNSTPGVLPAANKLREPTSTSEEFSAAGGGLLPASPAGRHLGGDKSKTPAQRLAKFLAQELIELDVERDPNSRAERIEELIRQAGELFHIELRIKNKEVRGDDKKLEEKDKNTELGISSSGLGGKEERKTEDIGQNKPSHGGTAAYFRWVAESVASAKHPDRNEDHWAVVNNRNGVGVFDGVSAVAGAAEASRGAAGIFEKIIESHDPNLPLAELPGMLEVALFDIHGALKRPKEQGPQTEQATTATLALIAKEGNRLKLAFGSVGDSRVGIWHKTTGTYTLPVLDDHLLRFLLSAPSARPPWVATLLVKHHLETTLQLSSEQAAELATVLDDQADPRSHSPLAAALFAERSLVSQVLGSGSIKPHIGLADVSPGDRVLLASDGLHDNLTESEIVQILSTTDVKDVATALIVRAQEVALSGAPRAKQDDVTAVVLEVI